MAKRRKTAGRNARRAARRSTKAARKSAGRKPGIFGGHRSEEIIKATASEIPPIRSPSQSLRPAYHKEHWRGTVAIIILLAVIIGILITAAGA